MNSHKTGTYTYKFGMEMRYETWCNFRLDFTSSILISLYNVVAGQFYVPMAIQHGATNFEVGLLTAAPAIGFLLSPAWAGMMGNKSPKPYVLWPNLIGRLSVCVVALWLSPWVFVLVSFFINLLAGVQGPAYPALLTRIYPLDLRGRLMGYVRVAQCCLLIPLAYLVGRWMNVSGDTLPLIFGSFLGVLSILIFYGVREVEPISALPVIPTASIPLRKKFHSQWELLMSTPSLGVFLLAVSTAGFGNLLSVPLFQIFQIHTLHLNSIQIGVTRTVYYALLLLAYFSLGWIIDKVSPKHAMLLGISAYAVAPLLYVIFGNFDAVIAANACLGIGDATWDIGVMAFIFKLVPGREAAVFGLHFFLFGIRGTIAPLLSTGIVQVMPLQIILIASTVCCLIGALLMTLTRPFASSENHTLAL